MCGIVGVNFPNLDGLSGEALEQALIKANRLLEDIKHRGGDSRTIKILQNSILAANRLGIVDLGGGDNPLENDDMVVAFNGEIYNHKQIRKKLEARGYRFETNCDTEVVAASLREWGADAFKKLKFNGMYAIVAKDKRNGDFIVATDPFSIKPLYRAVDKDGVEYYCSEFKELQKLSAMPGQITKLPPGTVYVNGKEHTYFNLKKPEILDKPPTKKEIRKLLVNSVKESLPPGKFGVYLSGGVDSRLITWIAATKLKRKDDLVVFISGRDDSSDVQGALVLAKRLKLRDDQIVRVDLEPKQTMKDIEGIVRHLGQFDYFQVANAVNFYACSRAMKERGLRVALCGDGSDELFSGYFHYLAGALKFNRELFKDLPPGQQPSKEQALQAQEYVTRWSQIRLPQERTVGVDAPSMAFTIEARVPFLTNPELVKAAQSIPIEKLVKIVNGEAVHTKTFLREAFEDVAPQFIVKGAKVPGYMGAKTLGPAGGNPFVPFTEECVGTVRDFLRQVGTPLLKDKKFCAMFSQWYDKDDQTPETAAVFDMWQRLYPEMAQQAAFHKKADVLSQLQVYCKTTAPCGALPEDAMIPTHKGPVRAKEYFTLINACDGKIAEPKAKNDNRSKLKALGSSHGNGRRIKTKPNSNQYAALKTALGSEPFRDATRDRYGRAVVGFNSTKG